MCATKIHFKNVSNNQQNIFWSLPEKNRISISKFVNSVLSMRMIKFHHDMM